MTSKETFDTLYEYDEMKDKKQEHNYLYIEKDWLTQEACIDIINMCTALSSLKNDFDKNV